MKNIIVGNWKMNLNNRQSELLVERLKKTIKTPKADIVICPSFLSLYTVKEKLANTKIKIGAQSLNYNDEGPFTGEISGTMLRGSVRYCIVGHSERRIHFSETDEDISKKVASCIRNKITPIICVGENLQQREEGLAKRTVADQLDADLSELTSNEVSNVIIAYEPVWAIGTGKNCEPYEVEQMIIAIRRFLINKYRAKVVSSIKILYGGSVNSDNAAAYLAIDSCRGLLVGGASLNYRQFSKICEIQPGKKLQPGL